MNHSIPKKRRDPFVSKFIHLSSEFNLDRNELMEFLINYQNKYHDAVERTKTQQNSFSKDIMDNRSLSEYMYDLCEGWIMEDLLSYSLNIEFKKIGDFKVTLQGSEISNEGRKIFFTSKKVSSKADIEVKNSKSSVKIEIQFTNKERKSYDIKETKIRQAKRESGLILVYSLPMKKGFIIDSETDLHYGQIASNSEWGGKLAYNFKTENINKYLGFKDLSELAKTIQQKMEQRC